MEARAILRHARIAPRKVQIVLDLIRNQPVDKARAILKHTPKAASELLTFSKLKAFRSKLKADNREDFGQGRILPRCHFPCARPPFPRSRRPRSSVLRPWARSFWQALSLRAPSLRARRALPRAFGCCLYRVTYFLISFASSIYSFAARLVFL